MKLNVISRNASGHITAFNEMKLDNKHQYVEGSDDKTRNFVRDLPRIEPYTGANNVRISHEGQEYTLSYKFYTKAEKETYDSYRKDHKGTGGSGSSSDGSVRLSKEKWDLLVSIGEKTKDKDLLAFIEANKPQDSKVQKAKNLLDSMTPEQKAAFIESLGLNK